MRDSGSTPFLRLRVRWHGLVAAGGWTAAAATLAGFAGPWHWFLDLFSHFRLQYAAALLVAAALLSRRFPRQALIFFALLLVNGLVLLPFCLPHTASPSRTEGPTWRVMLANVNTYAGAPRRVATAIARENPDVLALIEVNADWLAALAPALTNFPSRLAEPRDDNFGIALFSRYPWTNAAPRLIGAAGVPTLCATVQTPDGPVTVIATHPVPPRGAQYTAWRDDQLARLPGLVRECAAPVLLIGDLNATPWNHAFRRLVRESGLRDSSRGCGYQATWPTFNPLLRIPLDHALHTPGRLAVARRVGVHLGSDHFPLILDCRM